jgi:hypothetical protein
VARYLTTLSNVPESEIFIRESLAEKLKSIGTVLAAAIPIMISIVELFSSSFRITH